MKSLESDRNMKEEEEINFVYKLSKEVNELREYLVGKIKLMDSQINSMNEKLEVNQQDKAKLSETCENLRIKKES